MSGKAVGRSAAALPWLCPNTDSLIRLAETPATLARPCETDPALLAFLLRFAPPSVQPVAGLFCPSSLTSPSLADAAVAFLAATSDGWVPLGSEVSKMCYSLTRRASVFARRIAEETRRALPDQAIAVATLAPLGWLAVVAIDPGVAAEPLHDPDTPPHSAVQTEVWGLDQNTIARRLATRWRLPQWIASALGNLNLPLAVAQPVVSDVGVFAVVQLAILETERRTRPLGLTVGADRESLLKDLGLTDLRVEELWNTSATEETTRPHSVLDENPHKVPLLPNLLKLAAESRRRNGASLVARLEDRVDDLHRAVTYVGTDAEKRVQTAKLAAMAELAAGAGHEINNPLAIISGHAQRLFRTEPEPDRGVALQTIIRQSDRIAGIIRDLLQFARPPIPTPRRCAAADLLHEIRDSLAPLAVEKGVRLELIAAPTMACLRCDQHQIKHALIAIVRNAIEAAGSEGWVRLNCNESDEEFVEFIIEDSGPGLASLEREHAFDPFYCGRSAGRGRGLGLPTAWQFARQNGGDLRHEPTIKGPTRFVLTVPRSLTLEFLDRQSA